ncbi:MAG: type II toxin-antitoxin system ParD family antitoxin [Candidatus Binatia bacterium]
MPKDLREFVDKRTKKGGFGTPTEYVRHLIRKDRDEESARELERLLLEGLKSGNAVGDVKGLFKRLHARVDELEAERKRNGKAARPKTRR